MKKGKYISKVKSKKQNKSTQKIQKLPSNPEELVNEMKEMILNGIDGRAIIGELGERFLPPQARLWLGLGEKAIALAVSIDAILDLYNKITGKEDTVHLDEKDKKELEDELEVRMKKVV